MIEFSDYGLGGPIMGAEAVGYDLANPMLGGPEQGGSYTGGIGGGPSRTEAERQQAILNVNPYVAPSAGINLDPITSQRNSGQTGYYFANELGLPARYGEAGMPGFVPVDPNATYRLVSGGTDGGVVYSGAGEEGLRNVFEQANQLTMDDPKNAYWGVEVLDPETGQFERVAENQGPNGLGIVGDIAGVALPIAAAIATGGASLGVQIAAGAAAGGLGGFLAGKDPLTSALIGGATAGIGGATGASKAIGGALDKVTGGALGGIGSGAASAAGSAAGDTVGGLASDIVVTGLSKAAAQGIGNAALQGATSGLTSGLGEITGYQTPADKFVQEPVTKVQPADVPVDDTIVVSANKAPVVVSGSGSPFGAAVTVPVQAILDGTLAQTLPQQQPETVQAVEEEPGTVVTGAEKPFIPTEALAALPAVGGLVAATGGGAPNVVNGIDQVTGDIVVNAPPSVAAPPPIIGVETALPTITEGALNATQTGPAPEKTLLDKVKDVLNVANTASAVLPIVGAVAGGGGGGDGMALVPKGGRYEVNPTRSDTFSTRGIANIGFDPFTYGQATGDQPGEYMFFTRNPVTETPAPITTPIASEPAAPAMILPSDNTYAEGGEINDDMASHLMAYHKNGGHTGPGQVKGIGSGQEDKIAAWLSDGEYVWSAQDVADLGDGSTDEGVRRLDKMRHMVRRRAGRKDVKKIAKPQKGIDHMLKAVGGSN